MFYKNNFFINPEFLFNKNAGLNPGTFLKREFDTAVFL